MSCACPIKRGPKSCAWQHMGSHIRLPSHYITSLLSRYVMRGALPSTGQLSNEDALGVEAEAFWVGWGQAVEQGRAVWCSRAPAGCSAACRCSCLQVDCTAACHHGMLLACRLCTPLPSPPTFSAPRACPQAFKALMDRMEANFSSDSRWEAETVPPCFSDVSRAICRLLICSLQLQVGCMPQTRRPVCPCNSLCRRGPLVRWTAHSHSRHKACPHACPATTLQGHACAAAGATLAGAAGEIAHGPGLEMWTCWWAWQMLHAGCCRRLATCKALCRVPVAGRLPPARLPQPYPPHYTPLTPAHHLKYTILQLDPPLYAHLEARECLSFFFCYRWLLILMKREFPFEEVGAC